MPSCRFEIFRKPSGLLVAIPADAIEWISSAPEAAQPAPSSTLPPTSAPTAKSVARHARRQVRLRPTLRQARGDLRR